MGVTSGNKQHSTTGNSEGMMKALEELATFCDGQLRLKEEEGMGREGGREGGQWRRGRGRNLFQGIKSNLSISYADEESPLDVSVSS